MAEVDKTLADHTGERPDRAVFNQRHQHSTVLDAQLWRLSRGLAVDQSDRGLGVEPQHLVAHTLQAHAAASAASVVITGDAAQPRRIVLRPQAWVFAVARHVLYAAAFYHADMIEL